MSADSLLLCSHVRPSLFFCLFLFCCSPSTRLLSRPLSLLQCVFLPRCFFLLLPHLNETQPLSEDDNVAEVTELCGPTAPPGGGEQMAQLSLLMELSVSEAVCVLMLVNRLQSSGFMKALNIKQRN